MTALKTRTPKSGPLARLAGAVALGSLLLGAPAASAADNVKLALNWLVSGKNAPYFVAVEKGFYAEQGLNVSISRGNGSGDTIKRVAAGESDFGLADTAAVIGAKANDESPVKLVGLIFGKSSVAILYVKGAIKEPNDLIGKKLGRSAAGASVNMFPAFLQANKIERSGINEVVVNPNSFLPLMLSKQVDAVLDQSSYLGRYRKGAQEAGLDIDAFRFADYGLDLYGDGIIVKTDLIKSNPALIKRFMAATLKGSQYAFENPDEAIAILRKTNPEIDADVGKEELLDTKQLAMTDEVAKHGLGYIDAKHMENVRDIVTKSLSLKRSVPVDEIYTLEFLPPEKKS
ncbi:ABC transporter substrate-binding protein [Xanthobacter sp. KR7-65]|uniref:ABC transporter substrate-binding protein n=1 Tax=Xanthobacter sp. KR7-65 TaxID=3156612 RepID=UPI0032B38DBD